MDVWSDKVDKWSENVRCLTVILLSGSNDIDGQSYLLRIAVHPAPGKRACLHGTVNDNSTVCSILGGMLCISLGITSVKTIVFYSLYNYEKPPHRVANEVTGTSNCMLILTSTPGPTALHPLRRMRCELYQVKSTFKNTPTHFRGRAESTPRRGRILWQWWDSNLQPFD